MEPGGWLIAASNQGEVSPKAFGGFVADGVRKAGRQARLLWWGGQAPDFPSALANPEGRYLKVGIYEIR
jgi:23S rRNA G2069 N7-methylase RlmK/C1962 C5-methylase RlmI